jgi:non-ribosomal peptide synthetase component E (peptide arylation enzyme)
VRSFLADRLARHEHPEALEIVAALPLTAVQKVDRRALTPAPHQLAREREEMDP